MIAKKIVATLAVFGLMFIFLVQGQKNLVVEAQTNYESRLGDWSTFYNYFKVLTSEISNFKSLTISGDNADICKGDNQSINVNSLPILVQIKYDNKVYPVLSLYKNSKELIYKQLQLPKDKIVIQNTEKYLKYGATINLLERNVVVKTEFETIPFRTVTVNDPNLALDTKKVVQNGTKGKLKVIKELEYINGKLKNVKILDREVVKPPKDKIIHIGTKKVCYTENIGDKTVKYWKKIRVWATSYDHTCYGCSHWTATGKYLTKGIIAVDPKVIDLHTTMYVPGYGFGQAEDVGGAVKGNHIDLGFDDLNTGSWSARYVDIYLIDHCMPELKFNWRTKWD